MKNGRPVRPLAITNALITPKKELQETMELPNLINYKDTCTVTLTTYPICIHYLDTDYNHHVNNRSYTNWILEVLPNEFNDAYKPALLDIKWGRQSYRGDKLQVIVKAESEEELTKAEPKLFF